MHLDTAVAFLIFNRPELTQIVFEAIRKAKPRKLLVVADGPRIDKIGETEKCEAVRAVIETVDWECEVIQNYSDTNLGCKKRISSGLDWVFSEVEEAIIIEDDCLPTASFFQYCKTLLDRFRHNELVMMIGGSNFQDGNRRTPYSYYFSKYMHVWGWATWRRAWQTYDVAMKTWPETKANQLLKVRCLDPYEQRYWENIFDKVFAGEVDTWDYQWMYNCWAQGGLSIIPNANLISNIGFGPEATHTPYHTPWANLATQDLWDLSHPPYLFQNFEADLYILENHYGSKGLRSQNRLDKKFERQIQLAINHISQRVPRKIKIFLGRAV